MQDSIREGGREREATKAVDTAIFKEVHPPNIKKEHGGRALIWGSRLKNTTSISLKENLKCTEMKVCVCEYGYCADNNLST